MKIFLSWSGEQSHHIAKAFYWWLPRMFHPVKVFISSQIPKGRRGLEVIADELEQTNFGIACLTPTNLDAPWIAYECGALSKMQTVSHICTFLYGIERPVTGPLQSYQHTLNARSDLLDLCRTINFELGAAMLEEDRLRETFDLWYDKFLVKIEGGMPPPDGTPKPELTPNEMLAEVLKRLDGLIRPESVISEEVRFPERSQATMHIHEESYKDFMRWVIEKGRIPQSECSNCKGFWPALNRGHTSNRG